jgi:hypothetical protein
MKDIQVMFHGGEYGLRIQGNPAPDQKERVLYIYGVSASSVIYVNLDHVDYWSEAPIIEETEETVDVNG